MELSINEQKVLDLEVLAATTRRAKRGAKVAILTHMCKAYCIAGPQMFYQWAVDNELFEELDAWEGENVRAHDAAFRSEAF
jgi:hypothetical protein